MTLDLTPPPVPVRIARVAGGDPDLPLPSYQSDGSAGMDLMACLPSETRAGGLTLAPMARALVPTGFAIALPPGFEAQVRPRSGQAFRRGLTLVNSPGTVDADYRGEVALPMINLGTEPLTIAHGERVAQMVVAPVTRVEWAPVAALDETARGADGFGSTGRRGG